MPAISAEAMVATSHPLATRAGLGALERGGNAVDAALAAAAMLTVVEPTDNGIGGDAFALVWDEGVLYGINGSGRSPADLGGRSAEDDGPRSVTVPGAVRLWADLVVALRPLQPRPRGRPGRRCRSRRRRLHGADRRQVGAGGTRTVAGAGEPVSATSCPSSPAPCGGSPPTGRMRSTRARSRRRSRRRAGSPRTISARTFPTGSSRCAGATTVSRYASCRRTAREWPRCSRSPCTTASSRGRTSRSKP